jgi:hypothetical protein
MPGIQEVIAVGIVALVVGRLLWRRWSRRKALNRSGTTAGACGDCTSAGPPPEEATVRFYRRRENAKD